MLLKYIGGMTVELAFTAPSGKEYVQKPGEDLQVADEDAAYFLGLGAWEESSVRTSSPNEEVKSAVQANRARFSPSSDTPAG
jgi:hypothetical protein